MKTEFKESFTRDLRRLRDPNILKRVKETIEVVENADSVQALPKLKKLRGEKNYFRLRIGNFRIGLIVEGNTIVFVRCLARKDIYRYFP